MGFKSKAGELDNKVVRNTGSIMVWTGIPVSVTPRPAASASPGNLQMPNSSTTPDLLNPKRWWWAQQRMF